MTEAERKLWKRIRGKKLLGVQFYRQKAIGPYIVDFYASSPKIVIELDGSQHFLPKGERADHERDQYLESLDLMVLRIGNRRVLKETDYVVEQIYEIIEQRLREVGGNPP